MRKFIYKLALVLILNTAFLIQNCFAQWEADVRLTNNTGYSYTSPYSWSIAANGNILHSVWNDTRDGNTEIYYKRSTDGGTTWGADIRLTNSNGSSYTPSIAVSGSQVHIVWGDYRDGNDEIYYKRSTDGGTTWGIDTRLTNNTSISDYPSIAVSGSQINVVWSDFRDGNREIYYKRSTDNGTTWGADTTRLTNANADSNMPSIAVSGSQIHIVWSDTRDGNYEIYYKRSTDGGTTWGIDTRLTNNNAYSEYPTVAVSGSQVNVVWRDERDGNPEIYYKRSTDGGTTWGVDIRLTNNTAISERACIAVSGSQVHIVWSDNRDGNNEIYYKHSIDGGTTWEADLRLTNNTAFSESPSIAVSGLQVNVVWSDTRDGNNEVYYKRNPTGNPTRIINISSKVPTTSSIRQNYPNPFNPSTKIKFSIVNGFPIKTFGNDKVVLKVYGVIGREIQTLVNESLKPGTYEATFDGSSLNSGVYFYKITAGEFSETKKMLMLK